MWDQLIATYLDTPQTNGHAKEESDRPKKKRRDSKGNGVASQASSDRTVSFAEFWLNVVDRKYITKNGRGDGLALTHLYFHHSRPLCGRSSDRTHFLGLQAPCQGPPEPGREPGPHHLHSQLYEVLLQILDSP